MASFGHDAAPAVAELTAWRQSIARKQSAARTPEDIARARATSERQARLQMHAKKSARLEKCSKMSRAAMAGSMMSWSSAAPPPVPAFGGSGASAPSMFAAGARAFGAPPPAPATPAATMSLFGASATPCQTPAMAVERSAQARLALQSLKAAAEEDNDDAGDEMLESAQQQLLAAGHAWAADGDEGLDAVDDALGGGADGDGGALDALLAQLRAEPADDAEAAAKFALYEAHAEAVATVRDALFTLWAGARADVGDGAPVFERALRGVDARANLELDEDARFWFVFSMATAVSANEAKIARVMRELRAKLEMLAAQTECPICLERLPAGGDGGAAAAAATTLGCAHRVCGECWRHWSATCRAAHKAPYCPLCRQDEFIGDVMTGV